MSEIGEDNLIKERKDKIIDFFRKGQAWVVVLLLIAVILGMYIRFLPMTDHAGHPGLYDITTGTWTLGPDLDPWLFLRGAETIVNDGELPKIDEMRNVPLGFDNHIETQLLPYMIAYTHKGINIFGDYPIEFAGAIFPVIMFGLTIISFFLFVRETFVRRNPKTIPKANAIAIISTFFMIVIPVFLPRTIAGIPEKESAAFFFLFLSFYLFLKAWKSKRIKSAFILGLLAGFSTVIMALIWGGVIYAYIPVAMATLFAFILEKIKREQLVAYGVWTLSSVFIPIYFSGKYDLVDSVTSLSSGSAILVLFIVIVDYILWNTKIGELNAIKNIKIPRRIMSIVISFIILFVLAALLFGPEFILEKARAIHQTIFKPISGRWNTTVAENRQPNFQEWSGSFGPYFKGIPLMFWLFMVGAVALFKKMLNRIDKKDAWFMTASFILLLLGMVYSRYSADSIFNGDNVISKSFYYLAVLIFVAIILRYYLIYNKSGRNEFRGISYEYLLIISLFVVTLFTVRGAVRLIMVLGPISSIFVGFLIVEILNKYLRTKEDFKKMLIGAVALLILLASIYTFYVYFNVVSSQAYSFVPSAYNMQWQKAMSWVRENTPEDSVFSHWWDYGYWVQSIGKRATMVDGGNAITYWNYLIGRHVLTGENQSEALELLYNHDVDYFLIDSTDIGKYTAFSSIGSNENYDRYSYLSPFLLDEAQTQETSTQTNYVYPGGLYLDEDIVIEQDGKKILLPANSAGIGALITPTNQDGSYAQPKVIVIYSGQQYEVSLRYLHYQGEIYDFKSGIEATAYIFPRLDVSNNQVNLNEKGAVLYLSPRVMRGMLAQVYILDDAFGNFPNFKLAHTESSLIIDQLRAQGMQLPEFVYYQGVQGPIKIWKIEYTGNEQNKEEYVDTDASKYISWNL